jgi:hypothetical protein
LCFTFRYNNFSQNHFGQHDNRSRNPYFDRRFDWRLGPPVAQGLGPNTGSTEWERAIWWERHREMASELEMEELDILDVKQTICLFFFFLF